MRAHTKQYTVRNIPPEVDRVLRRRAKQSGKSFNEVAVEALAAGAGVERPRRDLREIAGSMTREEARAIESEIELQHQIDPAMWR